MSFENPFYFYTRVVVPPHLSGAECREQAPLSIDVRFHWRMVRLGGEGGIVEYSLPHDTGG